MRLVSVGMHLSNQNDACATLRIKNMHRSAPLLQSSRSSRAVYSVSQCCQAPCASAKVQGLVSSAARISFLIKANIEGRLAANGKCRKEMIGLRLSQEKANRLLAKF